MQKGERVKNNYFTQKVCARTPKLPYVQKGVREWR